MDRKIRSWRMMWSLALLGVIAVPAFRVAAAQAAGQGTTTPVVKDDLFAGTEQFAKGASSVTQINMDPQSLDEIGGRDAAKARNTVLSVVHTYSYDKPGMYSMAEVQKYRQKLDSGDWHCSVHTYNDKGDSTDVCERHRTDGLHESAIITVSPKSLTFIHTIRRKGAGETTGFLMMDSLSGLPALAMLDPQVFVNLQMTMNRMPVLDSAEMRAKVDSAMQSLHQLDTVEMQKKMGEAMNRLKEEQKNFKLDQRQFGMDGAGATDGQPKQPE